MVTSGNAHQERKLTIGIIDHVKVKFKKTATFLEDTDEQPSAKTTEEKLGPECCFRAPTGFCFKSLFISN